MQRDDAYLLDMLLAARRAQRFCAGITQEEFERSDLHQYAVFKAIEILGEAARLVSNETRQAHPEIPWQQIAGMRNRLIHEYFRVDLPTVWQAVRDEIAPLIARIEPLVPPEQPCDPQGEERS
jgi:uncharacterized protein with HEPN domain